MGKGPWSDALSAAQLMAARKVNSVRIRNRSELKSPGATGR